MQIIEVTWGMAFRVWWSFCWRSLLFGILAGIAVGIVFALISTVFGLGDSFHRLSAALSFGAGIVVAVWVIKKILYKRYGDFSVVCIANEPVAVPQEDTL